MHICEDEYKYLQRRGGGDIFTTVVVYTGSQYCIDVRLSNMQAQKFLMLR
jgi:hypothetical protein